MLLMKSKKPAVSYRLLLICALVIAMLSASPSVARDYISRVTLKDGITVTLTERDFDPRLFRIQGCTRATPSCVINGKPTITEHQGPPRTYLASIVVVAKGQTYSLPVDNMYDPLTANFVMSTGGRSPKRRIGGHCYEAGWCTFRGIFGDGANVYLAQWEIFEGRVIRTILTADQEIYGWFSNHLDPEYFD